MRGALVVASLSTVAARCNPEHLAADLELANVPQMGVSSGAAPLTFLPHDLRDPNSAACLDGSPYGFYFAPSATKSKKWTISISGGGWCYDEVDCYCRSNTSLGSSTNLPKTDNCGCMNVKEDGSMDADCNCLYLPYSDGASFAGFRDAAWPVPEVSGIPANATVYFRGIKNFDGVLDFAMAHGMGDASELVVTGGSAGGLSTFLHTDRAAARVPKAKTRGAPVVGFFLDHDNFKHTDGNASGHGGPNTPEWSTPGTGANYTAWMKYIYTMQNLTFGVDGGLTATCGEHYTEEPHLCFMSPRMNAFIETPFFMFNSKYDHWQLQNEFQSGWKTPAEQQGVLQYGLDFLGELGPLWRNGTEKIHGGMITSCICHGCPWSALVLEGKTSYQHYADWYYGKVGGDDAMTVDPRLPNGNGTLAGGPFNCATFPQM